MNRTSPKPTSLPTYQPTNLTPRQAASRANGAKSKGPTTPEGKAKVSKNAMKHGLTSEDILLEDESQEEFEALRDSFYEDYKPRTALERVLFDRVVACAWKLQRIRGMERNLHAQLRKQDPGEETPKPEIQVLMGHKSRATSACPFESLLKLSRYEAGIERSFYRALKELEAPRKNRRMQAKDGLICEAEYTPADNGLPTTGSPLPCSSELPTKDHAPSPDGLPRASEAFKEELHLEAAKQTRARPSSNLRTRQILAQMEKICDRMKIDPALAFLFAKAVRERQEQLFEECNKSRLLARAAS